ncbi:uncharacterized protein [Palaemon carinicauda]|uniref:uncharacterized protein n=1 Tax=Palaemon carinicauda TaxID=392227 RepID=UPI0035B5F41A
MSDDDLPNKIREGNFVKYLLAVNETKRRCFEGAFSLLYLAWGGGKRYESLYDFSTEVLGWKKQDLKNLLCEAQMRHISVSSGSRCYSSSHSKTTTPCTPISTGENKVFSFEGPSDTEKFRSNTHDAQNVRPVGEGPEICYLPNGALNSVTDKNEFSSVKDPGNKNVEVNGNAQDAVACDSVHVRESTNQVFKFDHEFDEKQQFDPSVHCRLEDSIACSKYSLNHEGSSELKRMNCVLGNAIKKPFNFSSLSVSSADTSSQTSASNDKLIQIGKDPLQTATCISQPLYEVAYMTHPVQKATHIIQDVDKDIHRIVNNETHLKKESIQETPTMEGCCHVNKDVNPMKTDAIQIETNRKSSNSGNSVQECLEAHVQNSETFEISSIVKEAVHEMHYNPDDPYELDHPLDVFSCFMLKSWVEPGKLPERVLVLMLTEIFPKLPPIITQYVNRLKHLTYVVCYLDLNFDDAFLEVKLDELYTLVCDLITAVAQSCKAITERKIRENSRKFRSSKRRLRSARKSYYEHLNFVVRTREELKEAEEEFQKAQERNSELEFDKPRDCSSTVDETKCADERKESTFAARSASDADVFDEANAGEEDSQTSGSLLTSVMEEVAVIRRKQREESVVRRKVSRKSQYAIRVKQGFRNTLRSNVSAEQDFVFKGDVVSERQAERNSLARQLKKLRKTEKKTCDNEVIIKERIKAKLAAYTEGNLDDTSLSRGNLRVQEIRNGKFGKFLISVRMEAIKYASNCTVVDLKEWLIKQQYSYHEVQQVFSQVKVKHSKDSVNILSVLDTDGSGPSVIVLSGPKGCGKTCMCYYILHQWKLNKHLANSKVHEFDIVLYATLENISASGSWYQYLRDNVFSVTLNELPYTDIYESISRMSFLILLDVNVVSPTGVTVLNDMLKNLGHSKLVIAVRCVNGSKITEILRNNELSFIKAKFCPMSPEAITEYSSQLISLTKNRHEKDTIQFTDLISSLKCLSSLMYPLYMTYLLYVWLINPQYVKHSTTVSKLFTQVTLTCQQSLMEAMNNKAANEKNKAKRVVQDHINQLCKATWKLMTKENWKVENLVVFKDDDGPCKDPEIWRFFYPFIFVRECPGKNQEAILLHSSLAEVLCGFYFASKLLLQKKSFFNKRLKLETYMQPYVERYRDVMLHVAGVLVYNKHTTEDAKEIVMIYGKTLASGDFSSWLELLRECDFMSSLCTSVANQLMQYTTWPVANYSKEKNLIVADLLRKGAYQPKQVIISNTQQKYGEDSTGVSYIISALSTCTTTLVHLRQELQFYTWGDKTTCDVQVIPLQPPGTLQICWGHLGVEGAMALRHSHHLEELHVRISSCEALCALTNCLSHLKQTLRFLYLRLDIPTTTPSSSFQPLHFKGKKLWFRLRNISDSYVMWVIETVNTLSNWYTEVVLEESSISPASLHNLKENLPHISIHVSS